MYELSLMLSQIGGMDAFTLQPAAGAHGEATGIMIIRAYHKHRGEDAQRRVILVPDSAHGTNPASAKLRSAEEVAAIRNKSVKEILG